MLAHSLLFALLAQAPVVQAVPVPTAAERVPGVQAEPVVIRTADRAQLRGVLTRPEGARGRLPAILFIGWLSCNTVAIPAEKPDGWAVMLARVARDSGAMLLRVDKRGVGGSTGDCSRLDYDTEAADYAAALAWLRARPDVEPGRIVLFGGSMGSNIAPLIAASHGPVAGVLVWGGGARTWAERTRNFERARVDLGGTAPGDRAAEVTRRNRAIERVIVKGTSPSNDPALAADWARLAQAKPEGMYGRPLAFHRQAQRANWVAAWGRVRAPVLATIGANDWFEDPGGVLLIAETVKGTGGQADAAVVPGLDHHFERYPDLNAAFAGKGGAIDPEPFLRVALPWLRARLATPGR